MSSLKCDICGGNLSMDAGGKTASCVSCGMIHSLERVRELAKSIKSKNNDVVSKSDDTIKKINGFELYHGSLMKYTGDIKNIVIPYGVTDMYCDCDFSFNEDIQSVVIPGSLKNISGFSYCSKLTDVTIGEGVECIGDSAFAGSKISNICIPKSVKVIEDMAFADCTNLTNIILQSGVEKIGYEAFRNTAINKIVIPDSVNYIAISAFLDCKNLTEVAWKKLNNIKFEAYIDDDDDIVIENKSFWDSFKGTPYLEKLYRDVYLPLYEKREKKRLMNRGLCQHCGGSFVEKGVFNKRWVCRDCGREKDY